jgi:hypothetical protein
VEENEESVERGSGNPSRPVWEDVKVMFKFEDRPRPAILFDPKPRQLECVNCGMLLEWRVYTIAPEVFDERCPECQMSVKEFYNAKE